MYTFYRACGLLRVAAKAVSILATGFILLEMPSLYAITAKDLEDIRNGFTFYATAGDSCGNSGNNSTLPNTVVGNKVFYIGDSLTYHMVKGSSDPAKYAASSGKLLEKTKAAGYDVDVTIPPIGGTDSSNGAPRIIGKSVEAQGGVAVENSIAHLAEHSQDFDKDHANIVVIGLGTNRETSEKNDNVEQILGPKIDQIITTVRANNNPAIYWVNGYWTTPSSVKNVTWQKVNETITKAATRNNFRVLDYAAAAQADPVMAPLQWVKGGADGIHVDTVEGREKKADWIISQIPKPGSLTPPIVAGGAGSPSGYDPTSMSYPTFPDEASIASGIVNYIKKVAPLSPWLTMPGLEDTAGTWIMQEAKIRGINPLFIVASGSSENGFGTQGDAPKQNNFFGMKGTSSTYLSFATPQLGIQAFMDAVQKNTQSGAGRYAQAKNIYEYFSIHQTGSIVYPGEDFDPRDADSKKGITKDLFDDAMGVWISWDPTRNSTNPNPPHRGQYTPLGYYKNNIAVINGVTGLSLSSNNPSRSGGGTITPTCTKGAAGGSGVIDATGYSFPLAPQTRAVGGIKIGQTITGHHDGTPAYDLFSTDSAEVYAIYGGTPTNINTSFKDVPGCSSIMFKADDGFYYWYGHLKDVTVKENEHIAAGTSMAKIADPKNYTAACWEGGPHLHIDRGCTINGVPQTAGRDECRDPDFIPFLSKLYESLK